MSSEPLVGVRHVRPELRSFDRFAMAQYRPLRGFLRAELRRARLPSADADDLAQDVFVAVWRASDEGRDASKFTRAYLYTAARHRMADHARGSGQRGTISLDRPPGETDDEHGIEPVAPTASPAVRFAERDALEASYGEVGNWRDRAALVLGDIYGCDVAERRVVLGLESDNAVYVSRYRARKAARGRKDRPS